MKETLKSTSLPWQRIAHMWDSYFTVPSRISADELRQYEKWLKQINKSGKPLHALVMGATPELRDALAKLGYQVHSMDINLDMFLAMDGLLKIKNPNEVLIKANWIDNPLKDGRFDVIVGDAILPNIPWNSRLDLLKEIQRLLKPRGIFLTRAFNAPVKKRFGTVEAIMEHFRGNKNTVQSALEMVLELQYLSYDSKDRQGSFKKAKALFEKSPQTRGRKFRDKDLQKINDIVGNFWFKNFLNKIFIYAHRAQEEDSYKKYFVVSKTFEARDHDYSEVTPMYFMRRK